MTRARNRSADSRNSGSWEAAQHTNLLSQLALAHERLAAYWGEIALASGVSFSAQLPSLLGQSAIGGYRDICKLWIDCAEQAYAQTVHKEGFCDALAQWINSLAAATPGREQVWRTVAEVERPCATPSAVREPVAGCSVSRPVWRKGLATLHRYQPLPFTRPAASRPVLICYALVNRPYILDLSPECSWVRHLLASAREVYVIEWGEPRQGERVGLEDYVERYLGGCVRFVLDSHRSDALDLVGVCQGGTFSLCYTALHPRQIGNLVTVTTPVDFHTPNDLLSKWVRGIDMDLLEPLGNVPGQLLCSLFLSLMPFRLTLGKYLMLIERHHERSSLEDFVRVEHWTRDGPPQAAAALAQFVKWFYQENRLARGTLELAGRRVSLGRIFQPVLNIFALRDHIVPPAASAALQHLVGSRDYCAHAVDSGHVGIYVSRRYRRAAPTHMVSWLNERRG